MSSSNSLKVGRLKGSFQKHLLTHVLGMSYIEAIDYMSQRQQASPLVAWKKTSNKSYIVRSNEPKLDRVIGLLRNSMVIGAAGATDITMFIDQDLLKQLKLELHPEGQTRLTFPNSQMTGVLS